jgi:hypothetical protein
VSENKGQTMLKKHQSLTWPEETQREATCGSTLSKKSTHAISKYASQLIEPMHESAKNTCLKQKRSI